MTSPRDALRAIEARAYDPVVIDAGAGDMDAQDAFRRFEIEQQNAAAVAEERSRSTAVLGVVALLALVYFTSRGSKR